MSRRARWTVLLVVLIGSSPLVAQASPPERIDILVDPAAEIQDSEYQECLADQQAAQISGEIIVCGRKGDDARHRYSSNEDAENRYARETMDKGAPRAPDVAGAGIFRGKPTVSGICGIGLQKCPSPPAYMVDFSTLPDAPPGSDADRIARGLPPLGREVPVASAPPAGTAASGPQPAPVADEPAVNPSESASPAAAPSG